MISKVPVIFFSGHVRFIGNSYIRPLNYFSYCMRRLVLQFPLSELKKNKKIDISQLQKVKTLEILQVLRQDQKVMIAIGRIELKVDVPDIENFIKRINEDVIEAKLLDIEKNGAYVVFVKQGLSKLPSSGSSMADEGYFISREIRGGKIKLTYIGNENQVKRVLENLQLAGVRYRIILLTDAKFSIDSPLNALTEKQRAVLIAAHELGYFDVPRKISSRDLAKKLGLRKSALATHCRKAELRVLTQLLKE